MLSVIGLELKYYIKKSIELIYLYIFYCASFFLIGLRVHSEELIQLWCHWLWILLLFVTLASAHSWWEEDEEAGLIEQWRLAPIAMECVVFAKLFVHFVVIILPLSLLSVGFIEAIGMDLPHAQSFAAVLMLGGVQIDAITMLAASVTRGFKWIGGALAVMVMPLIVPTILFGGVALAALHTSFADNQAAMLLLFYVFFTIPLAILATAASLRSSD